MAADHQRQLLRSPHKMSISRNNPEYFKCWIVPINELRYTWYVSLNELLGHTTAVRQLDRLRLLRKMHRTESIFEPFLYARFLPNIPKTVLASLSAAHALYIFSKSSKIHCDHTKHSVQKMAMQSHQHTYTYHTFLFFYLLEA